ncbi:MAG: FecR family protein [Bacteroidota bacterium]
MFKKKRPQSDRVPGEDHTHDEAAMAAIEKEMLENIHRQIFKPHGFLRLPGISYAIAASILVCCTIAVLWLQLGNSNEKLIYITAGKGKLSQISLPDGSRIWLNSGSTLAYPQKFGKIRSVELINGEAFFDIKHDKQHPFVVHYGDMHAQVLGTSFNIKYYKKLNDVRLTVVTGLVEVGNKKQSFGLISPDKEVIYDQATNYHHARVINSQKVAAWKAREVNLYDVPFEDLMLNIENIYDIRVNYNREAMKSIITTIHFSSSDELKQVLEVIKTIHGLNYTITGKEVTLQK